MNKWTNVKVMETPWGSYAVRATIAYLSKDQSFKYHTWYFETLKEATRRAETLKQTKVEQVSQAKKGQECGIRANFLRLF